MTVQEGLNYKFNVSRVDGRDAPGGDKEDARYFVLDYVHDKYAKEALRFYADLCKEEYPMLSYDLNVALRLAERGE